MTHRAPLPTLLPFNLDPDAHFGRALQRAQQPLPYEDLPVSDLDLEYVADAYAAPRASLRAWRQRAVGALRELKRRWEGVTLNLYSFQEPAVRQVTRQRDIGFIALLMILTSWADTSFPYGLVRGLPAVGYAPSYGVFPQQPAEVINMADVLEGWQEHNQHILKRLLAAAVYGGLQERLLHPSSAASRNSQAHWQQGTSFDPPVCHHSELRETESHRQRRHRWVVCPLI